MKCDYCDNVAQVQYYDEFVVNKIDVEGQNEDELHRTVLDLCFACFTKHYFDLHFGDADTADKGAK